MKKITMDLLCVENERKKATAEDLPFIYVTAFDDAAVKTFYDNFIKLESDPKVKILPILINSYGGEVYSLLAMLDILSTATKPVCTVAVGKAMSCGSVLLAAGSPGYRYVGRNARVMIHEVASWTFGKTSELKADVKNTVALNDILLTKLAELCGKKDKKFFHKEIKKRTHFDWFLDASACRKLGLADLVGMPKLMRG